MIAGLRATNEVLQVLDTPEEVKNGTPDRESDGEKENEAPPRVKPKQINLPRSDSIGSNSGRKYLAPTLSDPAARTDKERLSTKKKNNRPAVIRIANKTNSESVPHFPTIVSKTLAHLSENSEANRMPRDMYNTKSTLPKVNNAMHEIRDWWSEQLSYQSQSSDDE